MFLLVPAYPGCPGSKAVKRSLLLLLLLFLQTFILNQCLSVLHNSLLHLLRKNGNFLNTDISQGSVATRLACGGVDYTNSVFSVSGNTIGLAGKTRFFIFNSTKLNAGD